MAALHVEAERSRNFLGEENDDLNASFFFFVVNNLFIKHHLT